MANIKIKYSIKASGKLKENGDYEVRLIIPKEYVLLKDFPPAKFIKEIVLYQIYKILKGKSAEKEFLDPDTCPHKTICTSAGMFYKKGAKYCNDCHKKIKSLKT